MVNIGKYNKLKVVKILDFGVYLDGGEKYGEILLPIRYVPENVELDDIINVFVYYDSEDRIIATTEKALASVDEFAQLEVVATTKVGAFLNWGLMKDLLVPFSEQKVRMERGRWYIVYVYVDDATNRIAASAKLDKFLDNKEPEYSKGEKVDIIVAQRTELGYKVIVDNLFWGMLYHNEIFSELRIGERTNAYIKNIRDDGKIDLQLNMPGNDRIGMVAKKIYSYICDNGGSVTLSDSSSPETIKSIFECSKKDFKRAVGALYKEGKVILEEKGMKINK